MSHDAGAAAAPDMTTTGASEASTTDGTATAGGTPDSRAPVDGTKEKRPPVVTVLLVRHGRSSANTAGILAGRTPGVQLDDHGRQQAEQVAQRLDGITVNRLITSPLERCLQTVTPFATAAGLTVEVEDRFAEVDYGNWSGRPLKDLATEPLWRTVQQHPSAAVFPGGEGLATVSSRAAEAIRDVRLSAVEDQTVLICSHGDVIKAILADALGMHLYCFQRIVVAPASLSVIRYTALRPFVERINDTGDLGSLRPPPPETDTKAEAGSGAGAGASGGADDVVRADSAVLAGTGGSAGSAASASDAVPGGISR
jgi:probable phosphoglycerate mutase